MLADIRASAFYQLTVRHTEQTLSETLEAASANANKGTTVCSCTSILALASPTRPYQKNTVNGKKGTTVTPEGVKGVLAADGRAYTLIAHHTTEPYTDFMVTPPKRAKQQAASAEQPVHNFLVESVLPPHDDDAHVARESLLKFISLIALAGQRGGEKREKSGWPEDATPANIANRRSLNRYPTGDELPAYSDSA